MDHTGPGTTSLKYNTLCVLVQHKVFNAVLVESKIVTSLQSKDQKVFHNVGIHKNPSPYSMSVLYNTDVYKKLPPPLYPALLELSEYSGSLSVYTEKDMSMLNEKLCDFKPSGSSDSIYVQIKILYKDIEIFSDFCFDSLESIEAKGLYYKKAKQIEEVLTGHRPGTTSLKSSKIEDVVTILYKRIYTIGYLTKKLLTLYNHIPKTLTEKVNSLGTKDHDHMLTSEEMNALRDYFDYEIYDPISKTEFTLLKNYDFQWKNSSHIMFIIQHFLNSELFGSYQEYQVTDSVKTYIQRSIQLLDIMRL